MQLERICETRFPREKRVSEHMNTTVNGIVQDGLGQGHDFTQLDWVRQQFRDKLGFDPYPGTLNVRAQDAETLAVWQTHPSIAIDPAPGFCAARCYRVRLNQTVIAVWIIPLVPEYPKDLMELMSPNCLRDVLGVKSGDALEIGIIEEIE
jgi:riboflavin kinase